MEEKMKNNRIALIRLSLLFVFVCCLPSHAASKDPLSLFVSIPPQKFFVEQIGKNHVNVNVLVPPGADPHTYEPKPSQMVKLSKSSLYFSIGIGFEKATLPKIASSAPNLTIVRTDGGIKKIPMAVHHHHGKEHSSDIHKSDYKMEGQKDDPHHHDAHEDRHDHELNHTHKQAHDHESDHQDHEMKSHHEGDHDAGLDPHIWLSPGLVKQQADIILKALIRVDPIHETDYRKNHTVFLEKIDKLDIALHHLFEEKKGFRFMVFHPSWGYFADEYGLIQMPIEIEGKSPKPAQLKKLIKHARENDVHLIFVQPQFSSKSAKLIAKEIKGAVIYADPLAENWFENMRSVGRKFSEAIR